MDQTTVCVNLFPPPWGFATSRSLELTLFVTLTSAFELFEYEASQ